jgi:hypothetical protein
VRLVYYSLARSANSQHDHQWTQSIRSLRSHNPNIHVCLFVFNGVSEAMQREADRWRVMVVPMGSYREWLQSYHPHGSILSMYPTLHKFLVLGEANTTGLSHALYVDCDTFFFDDPETLFESPDPYHWCARESPTSRICPHGYDPSNVNEELIDEIVSTEGLQRVLPFNAGVCLLNNGIWETYRQLRGTFLDTVWRLMVGRHCWGWKDTEDRDIRNAVVHKATSFDIARALPYPSGNYWILEEIALWLTLGHVRNLSQRILARRWATQGYECVHAAQQGRLPIVAHYFSCFQNEFFNHVPLL